MALQVPSPRETGGRAELPRLAVLAASDVERRLKARLGFGGAIGSLYHFFKMAYRRSNEPLIDRCGAPPLRSRRERATLGDPSNAVVTWQSDPTSSRRLHHVPDADLSAALEQLARLAPFADIDNPVG